MNELNEAEKHEIIMKNILIMLHTRGDTSLDVNSEFEKIKSKNIAKQTYININNKYYIKFVLNKIITKRETDIDKFLTDYENKQKIIIVTNINKKIYKTLTEYNNTQIFWDTELLINLLDHDIMPKNVRKLTDKEKEEVLESYNCTNKQLPQIYDNDPLAKYFKADIGNILRIERYSLNSGIAIGYRIVIPSVEIILHN